MDINFPNELYMLIASFLCTGQRAMLSITCRRWHDLLPVVPCPSVYYHCCVSKWYAYSAGSHLFFSCGPHGSESLMDYFWSSAWTSHQFTSCEEELIRCGRLQGLKYFYQRCGIETGSLFLSVRTKAMACHYKQDAIRDWAIENAKLFFNQSK